MNQTESEITDISGTYKPCIYGKAVAAEYAVAFLCIQLSGNTRNKRGKTK